MIRQNMELSDKQLITRGAEAEVWRARWKSRDVVLKKRVKKGYRHPELDHKIRKQRIRKEARLLSEAKKFGVPVPIIYDLNEKTTELVIQYFEGKRVMDSIEEEIDVDMERVGRYIGKLHSATITHGDLTTSNIIYNQKKDTFCFIDFSLGEKDSTIEDMGVDLHLIREALISVHKNAKKLYEDILKGYKETFSNAEEIIERTKNIESRGRYQ